MRRTSRISSCCSFHYTSAIITGVSWLWTSSSVMVSCTTACPHKARKAQRPSRCRLSSFALYVSYEASTEDAGLYAGGLEAQKNTCPESLVGGMEMVCGPPWCACVHVSYASETKLLYRFPDRTMLLIVVSTASASWCTCTSGARSIMNAFLRLRGSLLLHAGRMFFDFIY